MAGAPSTLAVVGRFNGHLDVVRVALLEPGRRDPNELPAGLQLWDRRSAHVEHGLTQAPDQLVCHGRERAAVGHLTLDPLGYHLVVVDDVALEVTVLGVGPAPAARLHGTKRTHAAIGLELLAVDEDQLARTLLAAGQQ